ncbi:MAG: ribosome assembly cofactor RimP [Rikenellaceae bacterium]|nr:ribosome assembly cofactor RimP [Rikenellaceae bacterium]
MMDCAKILEIAEQHLAGTDMFVVECNCSPANEVELLIDSDTSVSIDACVALNRAIDAEFDRDVEDFSLMVASAGIGSELRVLRQYLKLVGKPVEVLLRNGVKLLATLDAADEESITLSYDEKVAVEGKKKKELQHVVKRYAMDEVKYTKEFLDYK